MWPVLNYFQYNIFERCLFPLFQYNILYYKNHIIIKHFYNDKLNCNFYIIKIVHYPKLKIYFHNYVWLFSFLNNEIKNYVHYMINMYLLYLRNLLNLKFYCNLLCNNSFLLFLIFYPMFH